MKREDNLHPIFAQLLQPFAPPTHEFRRVGGCGLEDSIQSTCTCGWKSRPVEGWRDDQCTQLSAQEYQHRMSSLGVQALRDGGVI